MVLPFGFLSKGLVFTGQHYAFVIGCLAIIASQIGNVFIRSFLYYLCGWELLILVYAVGFHVPQEIILTSMNTLIYFAFGALVYVSVIKSTVRKETFYNLICIAAIIQSAIGLFQVLKFDPVVWLLNLYVPTQQLWNFWDPTGTLGNPGFLAAFIVISAPFFFRKGWRYALPLLLGVLWMTHARGAIIPLIVGTAFYFFGWQWIVLGIAPAVMYALYNGRPVYMSDRFDYWQEAIRQVFASPFSVVLGMGPGAGWGKPFPLHSEWVTCLHNYGVVGLSLMAGYVGTIHRGNRILFTSFLIATINMVGNFPLHLAPSAFLIIIIAGLIERERNINGNLPSTR